MSPLKEMRPKEFKRKTKFIELEMTDFYTYRHFYKDSKRSFEIDTENNYQAVLYISYGLKKSMFLKKAILLNYFNSKCFYWVDAGYFREKKKDMEKYLNF